MAFDSFDQIGYALYRSMFFHNLTFIEHISRGLIGLELSVKPSYPRGSCPNLELRLHHGILKTNIRHFDVFLRILKNNVTRYDVTLIMRLLPKAEKQLQLASACLQYAFNLSAKYLKKKQNNC